MIKENRKKWFGFNLAGILSVIVFASVLCAMSLPGLTQAAENPSEEGTTVAYWQFNQGAGEQLPATNNPGLVLTFGKGEQGALPEWVETKEGKGVRFSGSKGADLLGGGKNFKTAFSFEPPFSIEFWLTPEEPLPGYNGGLFQYMEYLQSGFRCGIDNKGRFLFEPHRKNATERLTSKTALEPNHAYHIMFLIESDQVSFFIDDRLDNIQKPSQPYVPCQNATAVVGRNSGPNNNFAFNGIIRAVRIKTYKSL